MPFTIIPEAYLKESDKPYWPPTAIISLGRASTENDFDATKYWKDSFFLNQHHWQYTAPAMDRLRAEFKARGIETIKFPDPVDDAAFCYSEVYVEGRTTKAVNLSYHINLTKNTLDHCQGVLNALVKGGYLTQEDIAELKNRVVDIEPSPPVETAKTKIPLRDKTNELVNTDTDFKDQSGEKPAPSASLFSKRR